jgi:uncharacterized protein with FMN-binding domain
MKRALFAITGTVVGLVGLLSFKTHSIQLAPPPSTPGQRPIAKAPGLGATTSAPPRRRSGHRSSAPPAHTATKRFVGPAVQTPYGIVQVAVNVSGNHILSVKLPRLTAFDSTSQMINSQAAPILVHETMSAQSGRINTVSGATYTSEGYLQSLQAALNKAGI